MKIMKKLFKAFNNVISNLDTVRMTYDCTINHTYMNQQS